jgi:hypothetical protein
MSLQRLTLDHMSCFAIDFPLLGTTEYPHAPFTVAKIFQYGVQQNTLGPSCTLQPCKYSHTSPAHPTRQTH